MTEKARKQKWNTGCIPLLILYIIHGVFVTAYMGEYYPEVEFAFWVAEVFLVMHAYALCRLPHKVEWNDFWGINYLCTYIPTLPNSPKRSALYIRIFIRIFSASLVIIPPPAIVSARLHLPLHTAFYALLYGQAAVGTACLLILLKKKWTQHR